jgi:hypothetical protein
VTENFFSLLVCVRERGRKRGAPASWLWFSAAAGERERGSTREVWAGLRRLLRRNLGLVLCEISASSRVGFRRLLSLLWLWFSVAGERKGEHGDGWAGLRRHLWQAIGWAPGFHRSGEKTLCFFFFNKGILVTLHSKMTSFWVFHSFSQFQLTNGAIL